MNNNTFKIFSKENLGQLSVTITRDNKAYFKLSDVCKILGIKNVSNEASYLNGMATQTAEPPVVSLETVIKTGKRKDGSTYQQIGTANFINQTGLFLLIMRSSKADAKAFTIWVCETVLPSLTDNSVYVMGEEEMSEEEKEEVHREIAPIVKKAVKKNPLNDFFSNQSYVACDGTVFFDRESCIEYNKACRE